MIAFDKKANLKPYEPIKISVADMKAHSVSEFNSSTRKNNFDKYIRYSDDLKKLLNGQPIRQWVNGSFVTKKINPKDIDLITFVDH